MANSRICSIEGCGKAVLARGWCDAHYARWRAHGVPLSGGTAQGEPLAFLKNIVFSFDGDECLIWPYGKNATGYGQITINGKTRRVNRLVCEIEHGPPPTPEHESAHSCGKGHLGCVAKRHLRWATREENMADKLAHGTHSRGERSHLAKLTEADIMEIRGAHGKQAATARRFGISRSTVCRIVNRSRWSHI